MWRCVRMLLRDLYENKVFLQDCFRNVFLNKKPQILTPRPGGEWLGRRILFFTNLAYIITIMLIFTPKYSHNWNYE